LEACQQVLDEGGGNMQKRRGCAKSQLQRNKDKIQEVQMLKTVTLKLFLCLARFPVTNRFCKKEFLNKEALFCN
jgi:hypothetical protein